MRKQWVVAAAMALLLVAARSQAIRYEVVPEDKTVLFDDAEAILMSEYVKRAKEHIDKDRSRTAAAELRRVATRAGQAADLASGEARDALLAVKSEARRLAYAAETKADSAKRRVGEFAKRMENFLAGEWVLLEAKHCLARGDLATAQTFLTLAVQQLNRRAQRTGKDEGKPFAEAGKDVQEFMDEITFLMASETTDKIAGLVKTARELKPAPKKKEEKPASTYFSPYRTTPDYGASRTEYDNEYESGYGEKKGYESRYDETDPTGYNDWNTQSTDPTTTTSRSSMNEDEYR